MSGQAEFAGIPVSEFLGLQLDVLRKIHHGPGNAEYLGPMDLVYREGQRYPKIEPYDSERWRFEGEPKQCFANALDLALMFRDELTYVEGYALGVIPVHHAWCVTADGTVVDPTWGPNRDKCGDARDYFGIPFQLDFVLDYLHERGYYGMLDDWQNGWPLCKEPLDRERCVAS